MPGGRVVDTIGRTGGAAIGGGVEGRRADAGRPLHGLSVVIAVGALVGGGVNELASGAHAGEPIENLSAGTGLWDTLIALIVKAIIANTLSEGVGGGVRPAVVLHHAGESK